MRFDQVPMPGPVARRPRDQRGYPVPAITPWHGGEPRFALADYERSAACARLRLCSVCGTRMPAGPVWRVVGGAESAAIARAIADGKAYRNTAATLEAPGHRACMLYAAMVCPFLARPNARRGALPHPGGGAPAAGRVARGSRGAVVGFADYEYAVTPRQALFRFLEVTEYLPHESGDEHLGALQAELAGSCPVASARRPPGQAAG
jgi:hypothetical protein